MFIIITFWILIGVIALVLTMKGSNIKEIFRPNLTKIIFVIAIFLVLHFYFVSGIRYHFVSRCNSGDEICLKQEARTIAIETHKNAFMTDLIFGFPIALLAYILLGVYQHRKHKSN